jgi:hypothetical protein
MVLCRSSKRTVTNVATFDFCADIVAAVPDPITDEGGADGEPKKKRVRKKKVVAKKEEQEEEEDEDEETKPVKDEDEDEDE